jgi:hypothetical protein
MNENLKKTLATIVGSTAIAASATAQTKDQVRAWEMPHQEKANTIYVGSAILGVPATVTIAPGQSYSFDINTEPHFDKNDLKLNISLYKNYQEFLNDFDKRIKHYIKNNPELRSRLARDKVAFEQVKNPSGHLLTSDDALADSLRNYIKDLTIDGKESYGLAKMVSDMGENNAIAAIYISHKGGTVKAKDGKTIRVPGENTPVVLNISHLMQGENKFIPLPVHDTLTVHDTIPGAIPSTPVQKPLPESKLMPYVGAGVEFLKFTNEYNNKLIPFVVIGLADDKLSFGISGGYRNNLKEHREQPFPDPKVNGDKSYVMDINTEIFRIGVEGGMFFLSKNVKLNGGLSYNMVTSDTTGTNYLYTRETKQVWVPTNAKSANNNSDIACGHWETKVIEDTIVTPINGRERYGFPTIDLGIEKYVKKFAGVKDFSVGAQASIPVFTKYSRSNVNNRSLSDFSIGAHVRKYFGGRKGH